MSSPPSGVSRRTLLASSALATAGTLARPAAQASAAAPAAASDETAFQSTWAQEPDRVWLGANYWSAPLQDWRVAGGRAECRAAQPNRVVHLLTRQLAARPGSLVARVRIGRIGSGSVGGAPGSAGFRVGIQGPLDDYRHALLNGQGWDAGLTGTGALFLGDVKLARAGSVPLDVAEVELTLSLEPAGEAYRAVLVATDAASGRELGRIERADLPAPRLVGNVALVANFGGPPAPRAQAGKKPGGAAGPGNGTFWFADWRLSGSKLDAHPDRAFGPILFSQYTLHAGTLKLTAQMPPLGGDDAATVRLEIDRGEGWRPAAEALIDAEARTATFRLPDWDAGRDVPYRLVYELRRRDATATDHTWSGTIRREPVDRPVLIVADISCNIHTAFPNTALVAATAAADPDLLAFTGDQFYESTAGYGVTVAPLEAAILDYLRKWWIHGWTWRELLRDRPSLAIPDDHDVYQGNLWGDGGAGPRKTQEQGGYRMPAAWVNVVHRTQTSHHPDPYDAAPAAQGITNYYGPLTYGGVSFAILADRMYKTGPEGRVPPTGGRGDHVTDSSFDPRTADLPGLELLGPKQMEFLAKWIEDWRDADMKAVISQTIFTAMATTHGGERQRLVADYDANGWPQAQRREVLSLLRKAQAVHLAGDQHLPAVVHYGVEGHADAAVAFAGPAVNVGYPRWWEPATPGANRRPGQPETLGDFADHFGNPLTVLAVANGAVKPRPGLLDALVDRSSGLGLVRFDKRARTITFECWPLLADPTDPAARQFAGWPITVSQADNDGRRATALLPTLRFSGDRLPVVKIVAEGTGEVVRVLRAPAAAYQPGVFAEGVYTVEISLPEQGRTQTLRGLMAAVRNERVLDVHI